MRNHNHPCLTCRGNSSVGNTDRRAQKLISTVIGVHGVIVTKQHQLWPDWRHHAFITNRADLDTIAADRFHREHAVVELAIRDLKEGAGLEHIPSGNYSANAAWLLCAVLAHNLGCWTTLLADQPPATNRTRRTRLISLPAIAVNRSGKPTLRLPTRWPWAQQFNQTLDAIRALPGPSG